MIVLSYSDIITNSSSEVFCTVTADSQEVLEMIKEDLGFLKDGIDTSMYIDDNVLYVDLGYDASFYYELLVLGMEKYIEPWAQMYNVKLDFPCE